MLRDPDMRRQTVPKFGASLGFSLISFSAHPRVSVFMAVLAEPFKVGSANVMSGWCIR